MQHEALVSRHCALEARHRRLELRLLELETLVLFCVPAVALGFFAMKFARG